MTAANVDLHCHSTASDGTLAPAALATRARARGVTLWSLTDHDDLSGQDEARGAAAALGLPYLSGVEISVSFAGHCVHILGYGFDLDDRALRAGLAGVRAGRDERAKSIARALTGLGIDGAYEGALRHAGNPALVSRAHVARYLVECGVCTDMDDAFRRYLGDGRPAHVAHRWAALGEAVRWITGAGGIAAVAHPARCGMPPTVENALFTEFIAAGGRGVEVVTGAHTAAEQAHYAEVARAWGLLASRGSDFHSPAESRVDLGALPPLPQGLTPVWAELEAMAPPIA